MRRMQTIKNNITTQKNESTYSPILVGQFGIKNGAQKLISDYFSWGRT